MSGGANTPLSCKPPKSNVCIGQGQIVFYFDWEILIPKGQKIYVIICVVLVMDWAVKWPVQSNKCFQARHDQKKFCCFNFLS